MDGKLALVTGGNAGIGVEISRGLAKRGASVLIAARNQRTAEQAVSEIAQQTGASLQHLKLDLSDLESVKEATARVDELRAGRPVDVLVANAGSWPEAYGTSAQGHEIAFATNTLGHHCLIRGMLDRKMLAPRARVVILTGDLYIRTDACTSDFKYEGKGEIAYCRSKLGNNWFARQLQERWPELEVVLVHPGVIHTGLTHAKGFGAKMQQLMLLDVVAGAQVPLWCATQPGLGGAAYYHNTQGRMLLDERDPVCNDAAARALWDRLEELSAGYR